MATRRGANALEFALLLPVFVLFLGGSIQYSWLVVQRGNVRSAVAEGCRFGSMQDPGFNSTRQSDVVQATVDAMLAAYEADAGECSTCLPTAQLLGAPPTRSIRCRFTAPFQGLVPWVGDHNQLSDEVVIRLEYQRSP